MMSKRILCAAALVGAAACEPSKPAVVIAPEPGETRLSNIVQLTFGGENAEAYWSADGKWITFQSSRDGRKCDQQYVMRADGSDVKRISDGRGKTTCGWFFPGGERLFFGSSSAHEDACPVKPDPSKGYVWPLDPYDIYTVNRDGSDLKRLTNYDVYTAEGVLSPDGTTHRLHVAQGRRPRDLHDEGRTAPMSAGSPTRPAMTAVPWWSPDGKRIVYRANHPQDAAELAAYRGLLAEGLIRPSKVELFIMDADGSNQRQVTALGGANFGPSWSPDGTKIIFSSNFVAPRSGNFELYLIDANETMATADKLERITTSPVFDGFAMFSPDGKKLMWASNRSAKVEGETNVFVADFHW